MTNLYFTVTRYINVDATLWSVCNPIAFVSWINKALSIYRCHRHTRLVVQAQQGEDASHQQINDLVWRALTRANIPAIKEPSGLLRSDGKRSDGLTQIPWQAGKCLILDVTIADTLAASFLASTSLTAGSAAETAAKKIAKYTDPSRSHI